MVLACKIVLIRSILKTVTSDSMYNLGYASTRNAALIQTDENGVAIWESTNFTVNATSNAALDLGFTAGGTRIFSWSLYYQKRVIDSSTWVTESVGADKIEVKKVKTSLLPYPNVVLTLVAVLLAGKKRG